MSNRRLGILVAAAFALIFAAAGYVWLGPRLAPVVSYTTLEHGIVAPQALAGKVVLVNFWSTSCVICIREMPRIAALHRRFEARGLETIAVAMPYDPPNLVAAYQKRTQLPFKVAIDPNGEVTRRFEDVKVTPTTYLIDRQGRVLKRYVGEPDFAEVERIIERALAG